MPTVSALRSRGRGRVAVDLDGKRWRVLPLEVVVRTRLTLGLELDRPTLRLLRRELRRHEAELGAARALRYRDLSRARLAGALEGRGVAPAQRAATVAALERAGLVDDARLARSRAEALAERGLGDEAIRADLERQGVARELAERAVESLEPEDARAVRLAARRGSDLATARFLARKGFAPESIEAAVPGIAEPP